MTLTGRLSAYRTDVIVREDFIKQIENDILLHPLYGKFRFLMGDDKSSWFYLLKNKFNMLYLPDVLCYSLESRDGSFLELSRSLPFRWNGNTLRNNSRALSLGTGVTGIYIWFVILDQRLNMWTSLVGIVSALVLGIFKSIYYLLFFIVWILFIRVFQLFVISLGGHPVSIYTLPIMLFIQWVGALVKIDAYHDLANQKWSKGGEVQSSDANVDMIKSPLTSLIPKVIKYSSIVAFIFVMMLSHGVFYLPSLNAFNKKPITISHAYVENLQVLDLSEVGVGKGKNSAKIINKIISNYHGRGLVLKLPNKKIDIYEPIIINQDNITLQGQEKSVIISHLKKPHKAVIQVVGKRVKRIGHIEEDIINGCSIFKLQLDKGKVVSPYLLLREPNDRAFLQKLGAKKWNKKYPYLRQQIVKVAKFDIKESLVYTQKPILLKLSQGAGEVFSLDMCENIHLKDFKITQIVPNDDINEYSFVYKNMLPKYQVDLVRFDYAAFSSIENVKLLAAGRHPLVFENGYALLADGVKIDKSWNKGKGGSGYFRVARTYHSEIKNCDIFNIRHLTLQWSSAGNHLHHLNMTVDINLHGGFTYDNKIDHVRFFIPKKHKWKAISSTPQDARWAPPDGNNFIDKGTIDIRK
jgi:glycosyltransferase Alg8